MSRAARDSAPDSARDTAPDSGAPAQVTLFCADAEATAALGARLGRLLRGGDCLALRGSLGAGKTTLAQGIVAGLGSRDRVTSPTFTLVNEYTAGLYTRDEERSGAADRSAAPLVIYHVDLYRLAESAAPAAPAAPGASGAPAAPSVALLAGTLGLDDLIGAPDALLLVEWAELAPGLLPHDHLQVLLAAPETGGRLVSFVAAADAPRAQALVAALR